MDLPCFLQFRLVHCSPVSKQKRGGDSKQPNLAVLQAGTEHSGPSIHLRKMRLLPNCFHFISKLERRRNALTMQTPTLLFA